MSLGSITYRLCALACSLAFCLPAGVCASADPDGKLLKAAFVYNFAKFTEWPEEASPATGKTLNLCVTGDDELTAALGKLSGKKVRQWRVTTRYFAGAVPDGCHLLYIGNSRGQLSSLLLASVRTRPVLTIGQSARFAEQGGIIQLYNSNGRLRFLINLTASRRAGLKLSSRLLNLADIYEEGGGR